jgi:hypothetical protein
MAGEQLKEDAMINYNPKSDTFGLKFNPYLKNPELKHSVLKKEKEAKNAEKGGPGISNQQQVVSELVSLKSMTTKTSMTYQPAIMIQS